MTKNMFRDRDSRLLFSFFLFLSRTTTTNTFVASFVCFVTHESPSRIRLSIFPSFTYYLLPLTHYRFFLILSFPYILATHPSLLLFLLIYSFTNLFAIGQRLFFSSFPIHTFASFQGCILTAHSPAIFHNFS